MAGTHITSGESALHTGVCVSIVIEEGRQGGGKGSNNQTDTAHLSSSSSSRVHAVLVIVEAGLAIFILDSWPPTTSVPRTGPPRAGHTTAGRTSCDPGGA